MSIKVCVFDAYGTLLDVNSAAKHYAATTNNKQFKEAWKKIAIDWREKQLSYSWLRTIMNMHVDFWEITKDSLDYALDAAKITSDENLKLDLLRLYLELEPYPEVRKALLTLRDLGFKTSILSNGSVKMLNSALDSAGIKNLFDKVLSVDDVKVFKPSRVVYQKVCESFECSSDEVLFVSSNGWDISGALSAGFHCVWINRFQLPIDRLPNKPTLIQDDLKSLHNLLN